MNKKIFAFLILLLVVSFGATAFASLTFTTNAITGTTASTIDLGAGNTLSLNTTNNAPITTGTGLVTLGGVLNVTGKISASNFYDNGATSDLAVGVQALNTRNIMTGHYNTALGAGAIYSNTTGIQNVSIGPLSLFSSTTGSDNVSIGTFALQELTTGSRIIAIGTESGERTGASPSFNNAVTTGTNLTFIGHQSGLGSPTQRTNSTAIGYQAYVDADNTVVLGNSTVTDVLAGSTSGARQHGLSFMSTRGVPASSSGTCVAGESWDALDTGTAYHYYCSATNTIVRVAMATW